MPPLTCCRGCQPLEYFTAETNRPAQPCPGTPEAPVALPAACLAGAVLPSAPCPRCSPPWLGLLPAARCPLPSQPTEPSAAIAAGRVTGTNPSGLQALRRAPLRWRGDGPGRGGPEVRVLGTGCRGAGAAAVTPVPPADGHGASTAAASPQRVGAEPGTEGNSAALGWEALRCPPAALQSDSWNNVSLSKCFI